MAEKSNIHSLQPAAVDLFCGAGGLSYGLQRAGITIRGGIDIDPAGRHPFETNIRAPFHVHDIAKLSPAFVASLFPPYGVRVLAGCAPCQPFSTYAHGQRGQQQWQLLSHFGALVRILQPDIVTMENVPRLAQHAVFAAFLSVLRKADYHCSHAVVRCADYGVPQTRARLVLLASRFGHIELPPPTCTRDEYTTVRDAIQHMESLEAGAISPSDPLHRASRLSSRNLARIRQSQPGGTWRDWDEALRAACHVRASGRTYRNVYGRMVWDRPAPTLTTQFCAFGSGRFGHPEQDRALSLREGALLQTFPEHYAFVAEGEPIYMTSVARLIGNAVPVRLGEAIGRSIMAHAEASS